MDIEDKADKSNTPPRDHRCSPNVESKTTCSSSTEALALTMSHDDGAKPSRGYINREFPETGYLASVFSPPNEIFQHHPPLNLTYFPHILHPAVYAQYRQQIQQQHEAFLSLRQKPGVV